MNPKAKRKGKRDGDTTFGTHGVIEEPPALESGIIFRDRPVGDCSDVFHAIEESLNTPIVKKLRVGGADTAVAIHEGCEACSILWFRCSSNAS